MGRLEDAKVSQKQNEAKQFKDWWQKVVQIKQALKQLEESGKEKTVVTREDIQNALREQAVRCDRKMEISPAS